MGIEVNVVSNVEHIPEIEREIQTMKEQTQATYCVLPFKHIPC